MKNRRIAVLAADGFEKVELPIPVAALKAAGAEVDIVSLRQGRVEIVAIHREPNSVWVVQPTRQLTDPDDGCRRGKRFLVHDRDARFTAAFADTLSAAGVETVRPPARSPNLNAYAEHFVGRSKNGAWIS